MNLADMVGGALEEDLPQGDLTTDSLEISNYTGTAFVQAKQDLFLSGRKAFDETLKQVDPLLQCHWEFDDGSSILDRQIVCRLQGNLIALLKAERTALNFLGHLSGIATLTSRFAKACGHSHTKILDTRKTLPLYRGLEKQAVVHGGGHNHRMNLSSAILVKENHLAVGDGIEKTLQKIRSVSSFPIEIEVKNLAELELAIKYDVQRVMLDNMNDQLLTEALRLLPDNIESEASGNMTLDRIPRVAALGVDYISVGALTHSAPTADFSMIFNW